MRPKSEGEAARLDGEPKDDTWRQPAGEPGRASAAAEVRRPPLVPFRPSTE